LLVFAGAALLGTAGEQPGLALEQEVHLRNVRQVTFGGENAEAYFSADDKKLILQISKVGPGCDQIYTLSVDAVLADEQPEPAMVSTGQGKTTCSYFYPSGEKILYSSTHEASPDCPPRPDYSQGYVWPVHDTYEIYSANADGNGLVKLTDTPGYDAEATISRDGKSIVFTSAREGDLDIYVMNADGSGVRRLTERAGYDGGPFFSHDGSKIVYRASHPAEGKALEDYRALLEKGLIRPGQLDLWVMDADGSNKRQVTDNGAANFGPFWHPDGKRIIFSSNLHNPKGRNFDLFLVNEDGSGLERVTYFDDFDGFPMFSSDGRYLVFASNRNAEVRGETNIFLAEWAD
jgi:Tol biopolymer transport system component